MIIDRLIVIEYYKFVRDKGFLYKIYIDNLENYDLIYFDDLIAKLKENNNYTDLVSKLFSIKGLQGSFIYSIKTKELTELKKEVEKETIRTELSIENFKKAEIYNKSIKSEENNTFLIMQRDINKFNPNKETSPFISLLRKSNITSSNNIDLTDYQRYKSIQKIKKIKY